MKPRIYFIRDNWSRVIYFIRDQLKRIIYVLIEIEGEGSTQLIKLGEISYYEIMNNQYKDN